MAKIDWSRHRFSGKQFEAVDWQKEKQLQQQIKNLGKMTFGKYKGTPIKKLKTNYLIWLTTNVKPTAHTKLVLDQAQQILKSRLKVGRPDCNTAEEKASV